MIDTSPAIKKNGTKKIYIRIKNGVSMVYDGKTSEGKWHVIDMIVGNISMAVSDLRDDGYIVEYI